MRGLLAGTAIMAVIAASGVAQERDDDDRAMSKVAQDVKHANERFHEGWRKRDLWTMSRIWLKTDYVSAIHPAHGKPFLNWDNVRASWKWTFGHNRNIEIRSLAGALHVVGPVAWVIDSIRFEATQTQTGQPILMDNILTTKIFENRDGKWLLAHYHAHLPKLLALPDPHHESDMGAAAASLPEAAEQANAAFHRAWSEGDPGAMSELWAKVDYVSAIHPDVPVPFFGWRNVQQSWQRIFEHNGDIKLRGRTTSGHAAGDIAWFVGSAQIETAPGETGVRPQSASVLTTKIFERRGGKWLLVHFHAHRGPPPDDAGHHARDESH